MKTPRCIAALITSFTWIALLCFTATGCRSMQRFSESGGQCQGGSCGGFDHSSVSVDETPAEMFATMNYESIATEQKKEAIRADVIARLPKGPDSLFAPYRS